MTKKLTKSKPKKKLPPLQSNFNQIEAFLKYLSKKRHVQPNSISIYERYEKKILEWSGNKYLYNAGKFKLSFPEYIDKCRKEDGSEYDQDYINGACSFARRFFDYACKHFDMYQVRLPDTFFDEFIPIEKINSMDKLEYYTESDMLKIAAIKRISITDLRNIAAFIMLYLSGMRIAAFLTIPIKDIDLGRGILIQDPANGTYTKLNKKGETVLLDHPILLEIVREWDRTVRENCPLESTWFARLTSRRDFDPKIIQYRDRQDPRTYKEAKSNYHNLTRSMEDLCKRAGIPYKSPHKGRYGNIHKWMETVTTMEEKQALAENSLHTLPVLEKIYSRMPSCESNAVMQRLRSKQKENQPNANATASSILTAKRNNNVSLDNLPDFVQQTIITLVEKYKN